MNDQSTTLTFEELATARAILRVFRYLTVVGSAVLVPAVVVLATPLVGWALVMAVVTCPLLFTYVLVVAGRQASRERRLAPR